jgi:hypothetical protein
MSNIYDKQELLLKDRVNRVYLKHLEKLYGMECRVYRSEKNSYSKVYGVESGDEADLNIKITVLITGDTFAPVDRFNVGLLSEGWMFSSQEEKIKVGDTIEVLRPDGRAFKFKLTSKEGIGVSTTVVNRYKVVAEGESNLK